MMPIQPAHSFSYEGAQVNIYHANSGEGLPQHSHAFSHATFVASGKVKIRKENFEMDMDKSTQPANLKAGEWHEIEAIEDNTVFINVFAEGKY